MPGKGLYSLSRLREACAYPCANEAGKKPAVFDMAADSNVALSVIKSLQNGLLYLIERWEVACINVKQWQIAAVHETYGCTLVNTHSGYCRDAVTGTAI